MEKQQSRGHTHTYTHKYVCVRYKTNQAKRAFDPLCDQKPNKRTKTEENRTEVQAASVNDADDDADVAVAVAVADAVVWQQ